LLASTTELLDHVAITKAVFPVEATALTKFVKELKELVTELLILVWFDAYTVNALDPTAPMSEGTNVTEEYTLLPLPYNIPHTLFTTILLIPPPLPPPPPEDEIVAESPFLKVTGEDPPFIVTFNPGVKTIEMLVKAESHNLLLIDATPLLDHVAITNAVFPVEATALIVFVK
jgi:hypothetical protein